MRSVIEAKQAQPIWKSRTVLVSVVAILSMLLTIGIITRFPQYIPYQQIIFSVILTFFGAVIAKYLATDIISMLGEIAIKVWADGVLNEQDIADIIRELLTDDNDLDATAVMQVEKKMLDKGYISKKVVAVGEVG